MVDYKYFFKFIFNISNYMYGEILKAAVYIKPWLECEFIRRQKKSCSFSRHKEIWGFGTWL